MLSGVTRFGALNSIDETLLRARATVQDESAPVAVYCKSDYGAAWLVQHRGDEEFVVSCTNGFVGTASDFQARHRDLAGMMVGSGDWWVMCSSARLDL